MSALAHQESQFCIAASKDPLGLISWLCRAVWVHLLLPTMIALIIGAASVQFATCTAMVWCGQSTLDDGVSIFEREEL